ncbi:MAG: hypothetical protein IPJ88_09010 [Myxococcales bacterium]|nr:MAG: hypothetical protein IPJ88_09010 [Myxococcales bacterium]
MTYLKTALSQQRHTFAAFTVITLLGAACAGDESPPETPDAPFDIPADGGTDTGSFDDPETATLDSFLGTWTRPFGSMQIQCEAPIGDSTKPMSGGSFLIGEGFDSELVFFNVPDCSIDMNTNAQSAIALPNQSCAVTEHAMAYYDSYVLELLPSGELSEQASFRVVITADGRQTNCTYAIEARLAPKP